MVLIPALESREEDSLGLPLSSCEHIGQVAITVQPGVSEKELEWISEHCRRFDIYADVCELNLDDTVQVLNAGALKVFVKEHQLDELPLVPERYVIKVPDVPSLKRCADSTSASGSLLDVKDAAELRPETLSALSRSLESSVIRGHGPRSVYIRASANVSAHEATVISDTGCQLIIPASSLTINKQASQDKIAVADIIMSSMRSDRADGLFPTIVVTESRQSLGLVYSSAESVAETLRTGTGVYMSRKRGLWYKGESSGATQKLVKIEVDCDSDCLQFVVQQREPGFCHLQTETCFGPTAGIAKLEKTIRSRIRFAPPGSYTTRLFSDPKLLRAKISEEADELGEATSRKDVAWEMADLLYFAMAKCANSRVSWKDVERELDAKSLKVTRRKGDAKPKYLNEQDSKDDAAVSPSAPKEVPVRSQNDDVSQQKIVMRRYQAEQVSDEDKQKLLTRPVQKTAQIMGLVTPIIEDVKLNGNKALFKYTEKFDGVGDLNEIVLKRPFPKELQQLDAKTKEAIDISFENIRKFHSAQLSDKPLTVETMPGVLCSRFSKPIERVGLYVPGGTAVLPSTAIMLGVPAMVAGCKTITYASPPRRDGTISPEIVYIADKVGADSIVLAGGAQAVAALAYGTQTVPKCDKIFGPGNQFVTAAKMHVQNDTSALVAIDMPAGPSEVLVIADADSRPEFVASDLLSQAEHGPDSQVVLIAIDLSEEQLQDIEREVHKQAMQLPRVDVVRKSIGNSITLNVKTIEEAFYWSNAYAPEHLILQMKDASKHVDKVEHAGSVFVGQWSPESCGDYSSGTNHSLPTYGYARNYSGVSTSAFQKHITSQELTKAGLGNVGPSVMQLAAVEGLDAHRLAVKIRMDTF